MREILFRGKRIDNGEWVEGFLLEQDNPEYHVYIVKAFKAEMDNRNMDILECDMEEVDPSTVGQYTGLTDKNGKRIFDGDICRNTKTGEIVSVKWHGTMVGYVWSKPRNDNKCLYDFGELFRVYDKYEVIGNIHDNPELVKEAET